MIVLADATATGRAPGIVASALALVVACSGAAAAERSATLVVSVAASLRDVVGGPIIDAFRAAHSGVEVVVNGGPSGMLARQIEDGAPVDVFVSAGRPEVERLQTRGLIRGEPMVLARNALVVIVPAGSPFRGRAPRDVLADASVARIATGDPVAVPFGAYAKQAFIASGLWDAVQPKLVFANDVRQALTYADQGAVDAAIVYATDARVARTAQSLGPMPGSEGLRIEAVAVTTTRADEELSRDFLATLREPAARTALTAAGFLPPTP